MRAAPDGFHRLDDEARVSSQLPELLNKKSNYRRRVATGNSSSSTEENVRFWIDAAAPASCPAMRWIVGGKAAQGCAASPSQMGRFETQWFAAPENLSAIADLSGQWIDLVHGRRPPRSIVLDAR